jgi:hypothetical protein
MNETTPLYRPVGQEELNLIRSSRYRSHRRVLLIVKPLKKDEALRAQQQRMVN